MKDNDGLRDDSTHSGNNTSNLTGIIAAIALMVFALLIVAIAFNNNNNNNDVSAADTTEVTTTTKKIEETTQIITNDDDLQMKIDEIVLRETNLNQKVEKIKEISGIRSKIITQLQAVLSDMNLEADIDEKTGSIRLKEALLFGVGIDTITPSGEIYLDKFIPAYLGVVLSKENIETIDKIIVEGHSDNEGTYLENLTLSHKRAISVISYIFKNNLNVMLDGSLTDQYFTVSGRSFSDLIENNGIVDKALSRRVEIQFIIKDDLLIQQLIDLNGGEY